MSRHGKIAQDQTKATFILSKELKKQLIALAKAENRTLSNYLSTHLESYVAEEQAGYGGSPSSKLGKFPKSEPSPR